MYIAAASGQKHVYCKLVELNCAIPEYKDKLVIQMGGLHTSMCFLKATGNHINSSGFLEAWVESGPIGSNASEQVMNGKGTKAQCVLTRSLCRHCGSCHAIPPLLTSYSNLYQDISAFASSTESAENIP